MEKTLKGFTIVSLAGAQGSGKSTLGTALAKYIKTTHIETSAVVQRVLDYEVDRDSLWMTRMFTRDNPDWLAEEISKKILRWQPEVKKKTFVLSGVREAEVHKGLRRAGARLYIFEITADPQLRFDRLKDLGKVSSAEHFLNKELNERKLGLAEVIKQAKFRVETKSEVGYDKVMREIHKTLLNKGIKCN